MKSHYVLTKYNNFFRGFIFGQNLNKFDPPKKILHCRTEAIEIYEIKCDIIWSLNSLWECSFLKRAYILHDAMMVLLHRGKHAVLQFFTANQLQLPRFSPYTCYMQHCKVFSCFYFTYVAFKAFFFSLFLMPKYAGN